MSFHFLRRDMIVRALHGDTVANSHPPWPDYRRSFEAIPPPRSDYGTIVLHWTLAIAVVVSLLTGLRLSADADHSVFVRALQPMLPQGEIWTFHFAAALAVVACIFAYTTYLYLGCLRRRVSPRKTIVLTLPVSARLRWGAINVILHWALFVAILVLFGTGVLLYLGHGGIVVDLHYVSALVVSGYILVHVSCHYMYGGLRQLLRLFRPQPLRTYAGAAARPFGWALAVGVTAGVIAAAADFGTRDVLMAMRVTKPPVLDGELDDPAWNRARPVFVRTQQGANLGGTGESLVEIRAVRDAENIYFAFRWEDPTRSLKRLPLIKRADGWHLLHNRADLGDETAYYEDKFSVMFSRSNAFGSGGSTHMGRKPLAGQPGALHGRGLHYTTDGSLIDVWQWKAGRGGMLGYVDDMWFGPPLAADAAQRAGTARYSAGYAADEGRAFYSYNYVDEPPGGYRGPVQVRRLPLDHAAQTAKLGRINLDPNGGDDAGSQWWMFEHETSPYSSELDAKIPVGTVLPSVLIIGEYAGGRADVRGAANWKDGHWTMEATRKLRTGNPQDLDMESGLYLWVAVFDRNQTRHSRHVRPVRLELP